MELFDFYKNKRVLVTGHTGFKGSWLCRTLIKAGALVSGYALTPPTDPALFSILGLEEEMESEIGDIRDLGRLRDVFERVKPEIVFHLAAQPIVRDSYKDPVGTYASNVMGTVHVMECARHCPSVRSLVNVTTDKVYENREWEYGYREIDRLDGYDPYSNSKSCSELVTHSYVQSFFGEKDCSVSTARAGNVIGGGDFANDRIVPDSFRAAAAGKAIILRNPNSTRPYQHVLEPLKAYMMIAMAQWENKSMAGAYNVGPDDGGCVTTGQLADMFCRAWGRGLSWHAESDGGPHEANFLKLDCSKAKAQLGWQPRLRVEQAVAMAASWYREYLDGGDMRELTDRQIEEFFAL